MCFQDDFCVVDGKPCEPGSIYCSEKCRESDANDGLTNSLPELISDYNLTSSRSSSIISVETEYEESLLNTPYLYNCYVCNTSNCDHEHHKQTPQKFHYDFADPEFLDLELENHQMNDYTFKDAGPTKVTNIMDTLTNMSLDYHHTPLVTATDELINTNNQFITTNYRKWLSSK